MRFQFYLITHICIWTWCRNGNGEFVGTKVKGIIRGNIKDVQCKQGAYNPNVTWYRKNIHKYMNMYKNRAFAKKIIQIDTCCDKLNNHTRLSVISVKQSTQYEATENGGKQGFTI